MQNRSKFNPFFVKNGRAMVSLGPLTENKTCPYSCAFCYVQDGFSSYLNLENHKIVDFLKKNKENYEIIYVSGDTDSFAPPRTKQGLDLLVDISEEINCDLLFTTRTIFAQEDYAILTKVFNNQKKHGKELYGCISITRCDNETAFLEPSPIPSPDSRIETIKLLKNIGMTTVLALRPFLPIVSISDYISIIDRCGAYVDIALGEHFFFQRNGKTYDRVFPYGISAEEEKNIKQKCDMPFDDNGYDWDIWYSPEYEAKVAKKCCECGIVFSMHSDDAICTFLKQRKSRSTI